MTGSNRALAPEVLDERSRGGTWERELRVPQSLGCWPGHFPEQSLVPGVLQVEWVMSLVERCIGRPPRVECFDVLKFTSPLGPARRLTLELTRESRLRFGFRMHGEGVVYSMGRFSLADGDATT